MTAILCTEYRAVIISDIKYRLRLTFQRKQWLYHHVIYVHHVQVFIVSVMTYYKLSFSIKILLFVNCCSRSLIANTDRIFY